MYFFYFDESGTRDPDIGTPEKPKDPIYVLTAVGMHERKWHRFEQSISVVKRTLADRLTQDGHGPFELADCEVKSIWLRVPAARASGSRFLSHLSAEEREQLVSTFYGQLAACETKIISVVVDKRELKAGLTTEQVHTGAYEYVLERIEHFMAEFHPTEQALVVMDDTNQHLNRRVAMRHADLQRSGNRHSSFGHIVEYPFFSRSELSNGVQLADLVSYNIYRASRENDPNYPYLRMLLPYVYRRRQPRQLDGLKVWPSTSRLMTLLENLNLDLGEEK